MARDSITPLPFLVSTLSSDSVITAEGSSEHANVELDHSKPKVALLQRAIPHYRFPLFKKLAAESPFEWIFYSAEHNQKNSTGLATPNLHELPVRAIRNHRLAGPFLYQSGVHLAENALAAFMLDLGWTLVSTPRYLIEARMRGIATIGWSKGIPQDPRARGHPLKRLHQKFVLSLCDVLVGYGKTSKEYFRALGFPESRIFVAQNTIDTARIARELPSAMAQKEKLLRELPINGRFVFGYMGSLVPRKKVESIIEAFNQLRRDYDAVLVIAGGGPSEHSVRGAATASPYGGDILIVGRVPLGEEGGYFQLFDAHLSFAQAGLSVLEAMAHGRTVVNTPEKYPETELLIDGDTALIAVDLTIEAFAEQMRYAVTQRESLRRIGARARECVLRDATLENMLKVITLAVQAAIQRRHPR